MGLAAGLLESVVWDSAGSESAGKNKSADPARARASDRDGGARSRSQSGCRSAASPDHQPRLRRLRSATRIGAQSRSRRKNCGSDFSSRRGQDRSASLDHDVAGRFRHESKFKLRFDEGRNFPRHGSDGIAAPVTRAAAVATTLNSDRRFELSS
jgi:hypothetical protein